MELITILDFYSKNAAGMLDKQNYHLMPFRAARELGWDAEIWVMKPDHPNSGIKDIDMHNAPIPIRTFKSKLHYLWALLKKKDAIIFSNTRVFWNLIACFFGKKTIFMSHQAALPKKWIHRKALKFFLKCYDKIRVVNEAEKTELLKLGIPEDKIHIIPLSIDLEFWKDGVKWEDQETDVITVANVRDFKNLPTIKAACEKAGLKLTVVGFDETNSGFPVTGHKTPEEVRRYLKGAKVYVNSSFGEGMCITIHEAAAAGLPLCFSDIPTFSHLEGLRHNPTDVDTLSDNLKKQIESPIYMTDLSYLSCDNIIDQLKGLIKDE